MNSDYIRDRTNQILREKVALGMTGAGVYAGARKRKIVRKAPRAKLNCPSGQHQRKAFTYKKGPRKGDHVRQRCVRNPLRCKTNQHRISAYKRKNGTVVKAHCAKNRGAGVMAGRARLYNVPIGYNYGINPYGMEHEMDDEMGGVVLGGARRRPRRRAGVVLGAARMSGHRRAAAHNPWIEFVREFHAQHPHMSYREAMMEASPLYRRGY